MNKLLPKRLDTRTIAGATLAALLPGLALAGPNGEQVVAGSASVVRPDPVNTVVNQTSASAVINWTQFNIGADEFVVFNQPSASSVVLNRVIGSDASAIFGSLSANGRVFLINPNGVLFAPGAQLDVGGLVASTLAITDDDFMNGNHTFTRVVGAPDAGVVNQGTVQSSAGGFVVLAGDFVRNEGVIVAPTGAVVLAAAGRVALNLDGMGLVDFAVDAPTLAAAAGVENAGTILADGGVVVMTARVANQLVGTVVNNSGLVRAARIEDRGGEVWLAAEGGAVANSGVLDASGVDGAGGRIVIMGDGDALVAGTLIADGDGTGAGGEVRAIAAGTLDFDANGVISARGGANATSAGGMVEVSGHGGLILRGTVEVGAGGTFVIDPTTVQITNSISGAGMVSAGLIVTQLNAGVDVKVIATSSIFGSGGLTSITAAGTGDLFLEIGNGSIGPTCTGFGLCTAPFPVFGPVPGGSINLTNVDITIGGGLHIDAMAGNVSLGSVAAATIDIGTMPSPFASLDAAGLVATAGGINLFGRNGGNINIGGLVHAQGGAIQVHVDGAGVPANAYFGGLRAAGNIAVDVLTSFGFAGIAVGAGGISAGTGGIGGVNLAVNTQFGEANIVVGGDIDADGPIDLQAQNNGGTGPNTFIDVQGDIDGSDIHINVFSNHDGGNLMVDGDVNASIGDVWIHAGGHGSTGPAGLVSINGVVTANNDIEIRAEDFYGGGGGVITMHGASGDNISLTALDFGPGGGANGATIFVGDTIGPSNSVLVGGAINASNDLVIEARGDGFGDGVVMAGAVTTGNAFNLHVRGGTGGGDARFVSSGSLSGAIFSAADLDIGGHFDALVDGAAHEFIAGDIDAISMQISVNRASGGSDDIKIHVGTLTATSTEGSGAVVLDATNTAGVGSATIMVDGPISVPDGFVTIHVGVISADSASILVGDITANSINLDNFMGNHSGAIVAGDLTADSINIYAEGYATAQDLTATEMIHVQTVHGDVTLGDLSVINAGGPALITVVAADSGSGDITVGAITAHGIADSFGSGTAARVTLDAGNGASGDVTVNGAVDVRGDGNSFTNTSASSIGPLFSISGNTTVMGFGGRAQLHAQGGAYGLIHFTNAAGINIEGVGEAALQLQAGAVTVAGTIDVTATAGTVTVDGSYGSTYSGNGVDFIETRDGGHAEVSLWGNASAGAIDLQGAVTITGPSARLEANAGFITADSITVTGGASTMNRTSSGSYSGASFTHSANFDGGGAEVRLQGGYGGGTVQVTGPIEVSAVGYAAVQINASQVDVGSITAAATGGVFTRDGVPPNSGAVDKGPFGYDLGDGMPGLSSGSFDGGIAVIRIGGPGGSSYGLASTVTVTGDLSVTAPNSAVIEIYSQLTSIDGDLSVIATGGERHGEFHDGSSFSGAIHQTIDIVGGAARIEVDGTTLHVTGAISAVGDFAAIDLGISGGSLGSLSVTAQGGTIDVSTFYDFSGTTSDFTVSYQGPTLIQGLVVGPDSGGSGSLVINGPIAVDAVGFGAVIIRAGSVTVVGDIDINVVDGTFTYFDSRVDSVPIITTMGDALLAVHNQTAPGNYGSATIAGAVTVSATGDVIVRSQFSNDSHLTSINATGAVTDQFSTDLQRLNAAGCGALSCSFGSFAPTILQLSSGLITGAAAIDLGSAAISFGSGTLPVAAGLGDPTVVARFGLTGTQPNGAIRTSGAFDLGHLGVNGEYVLLEAASFNNIGSATTVAGAVVQFVDAGGGGLALEQTTNGNGAIAASGPLAAFALQGTELVLGHSVLGGAIAVGNDGAVNMSAESVTLIGPDGITGSGQLSAATLALDAGIGAIDLSTMTSDFVLLGGGSVTLDNSGFGGALAVTLPATGLTNVDITNGGNLTLTGPWTGTSLTASANGNLVLVGTGLTASGTMDLSASGTFDATGVMLGAASLLLSGTPGSTDFFATTNASSITITGADFVALDNSARSGATTVTVNGLSPNVLQVQTSGALTLAGTFDGNGLDLVAQSLNLGTGNHTAFQIDLAALGAIVGTGTLEAQYLAIDGDAATTVNLVANVNDLQINEAATVTMDITPTSSNLFLDLGPGAFGSVDISVDGDLVISGGGITADVLALSVTGDIFGSSSLAVPVGGPGNTGGGAPAPAASVLVIDAGTLMLQAGGGIYLGSYSFVLGAGDGVTGVSDHALLVALAGAGIGPGNQTVANGNFLAGGDLELGEITSQGSYLVLQGDDLSLNGPITGPSDLLVQIAPATPGATFSLEDSVPGSADVAYTFSQHLSQITAQTVVLGASTTTGDVTLGLNGTFDVSPTNLIIGTSGLVTDIGNVTSSGIVSVLSALLGEGTVEPPILDEIDPYFAEPEPPVDTEAGNEDDDDEEGEDTDDGGDTDEGSGNGLVTQEDPAPAGICRK